MEDYSNNFSFEANNTDINKSLLPYKNLEYYTLNNSDKVTKDNKSNNKKKKKNELHSWTLDFRAFYPMTGNLRYLSNIKKYNKRNIFHERRKCYI